MNERVYISGPMSGYPNYNRSAFHAMADELRKAGYEVENPAIVSIEDGTWGEYMRVDIGMLIRADMVVVLPRWQESKGARLEVTIAHQLGISVKTYPDMVQVVDDAFTFIRTREGSVV